MPADLNDYFNKKNGSNSPKMPPKPEFVKNLDNKTPIWYVLLAIVVLLVIAKPYEIINSGQVGIKVTTGKFENTPLYPGLHLFIPGVQKIIVVDTKVRIINYKAEKDNGDFVSNEGVMLKPAINVLDARGLPVSIDLTVQYRLKPESAPQTIATWGLSWEEKIINAVVREVARNVVGSYKAEELPLKRNEIAKKIEDKIRQQVDSFPSQPVTLEAVQLREISLPPKIREQIEKVQVAKQEAQRVQYEVERAKKEAEKKAALAQGDADAKRIKAEGEAKKIEIEATAQAKANELIAKSLTPSLVKLKQIEVQGKFNEALKVNKDAKIFLTPGGATPNIWLDAPSRQRSTVAR